MLHSQYRCAAGMQKSTDYAERRTGSDFEMLIRNTRDMRVQWKKKMNVLIARKRETCQRKASTVALPVKPEKCSWQDQVCASPVLTEKPTLGTGHQGTFLQHGLTRFITHQLHSHRNLPEFRHWKATPKKATASFKSTLQLPLG